MNIPLREGDRNSLGIEPFLYGLRYVKVHTPVVIPVHPRAYRKIHTVITQLQNTDCRCRVFQDSIVLGKDILPIKTSIKALKDQGVDWISPLILILLFLPPLAYSFFFVWEKKKTHRTIDKAFYRRKGAYKNWKKSRKDIDRSLEGDPTVFYREISGGLKQFLGDRLNVTGKALTPKEIDERLSCLNVTEKTRKNLSEYLQKLEMAEFGALHQDINERKELLQAIEQIIASLMKEI